MTARRRSSGVPISIKDLSDTAGIRSTHGTAEWHDRVPERDDEVVPVVDDAGFVILGKTIVPEFGPLNISEPPGYPPGRNPWDPERIVRRFVGRSRGGARGGPVPDLARLRWRGVDPQPVGVVWRRRHQAPAGPRVGGAPPQQFFAINGPLARTVADAAALLDALAGPATGDAWWAPPFARPLAEEVGERPRAACASRSTRIRASSGTPCAPANRAAAEDAAAPARRPRVTRSSR